MSDEAAENTLRGDGREEWVQILQNKSGLKIIKANPRCNDRDKKRL
jgi:hypothetical protein